jgi:two-component system response regulator CpxR
MTPTILIVDDDSKLASLLQEYLRERGLSVVIALSGKEGLHLLQQHDIQAVVLDVMMPEFDGFQVLQEIRKTSTVPVIMLTARGEDTDRIIGLEMGADDYLAKPFNPRELLARIKAILRRTQMVSTDTETTSIQVNRITMVPSTREVYVEDTLIECTTMEYDILQILMQKAGRVVTRDMLMEELKGTDWTVYDRSLDVHISHLRKKIGDDAKPHSVIKTIRGIGYLLSK